MIDLDGAVTLVTTCCWTWVCGTCCWRASAFRSRWTPRSSISPGTWGYPSVSATGTLSETWGYPSASATGTLPGTWGCPSSSVKGTLHGTWGYPSASVTATLPGTLDCPSASATGTLPGTWACPSASATGSTQPSPSILYQRMTKLVLNFYFALFLSLYYYKPGKWDTHLDGFRV